MPTPRLKANERRPWKTPHTQLFAALPMKLQQQAVLNEADFAQLETLPEFELEWVHNARLC